MPVHFFPRFEAAFLASLILVTVTTFWLHVFPRLGAPGKAISRWLCYAPGLDLVITLLTAAPLVGSAIAFGWIGLLGGLIGQIVALIGWSILHELRHRRGARMFRVHHKLVGTFGNLSGLFVMLFAVPTFYVVRMSQYVVYPYLVRFTKLPAYNNREWVNVTRHKFDGLVGHDRIWCLYCDWMTGVWSLGTEMLRNIESFWCPIRFSDASKCANCSLDFPDVNHGWTNEHGNVADVVATLEAQYVNPKPPSNAWFGHPVRLTVKGKKTD